LRQKLTAFESIVSEILLLVVQSAKRGKAKMNVVIVVGIGGIIGALDGAGIFFAPGEPFKTESFLRRS